MIRYSIIIPAKNAAADITICLRAAFNSMPSGGELILIDDGSTDYTAIFAAALYPQMKLLSNSQSLGASAARNRGVAATVGPILVFLDADVEALPGTIEALVHRLEHDATLDAVFGSYDDEPAHPQLVSQFRNLLHHFVHQQANPVATTFWTGCGAMRRSAFDRACGFDNDFSGIEDVELGLRVTAAGGRIALDSSIQVKHRKRWTLWSMIRTDIFDRAFPWLELMHRGPGIQNDLNTRWRDRFSAIAVCSAPLLLLFGYRQAFLALVLSVAISWPWHRFLLRKRGLLFMIAAMPLHWLYLFYSAACFAIFPFWTPAKKCRS